ncbi:penicillin-binding transpeptidase domain-containing protein [Peptococcaceae bacterium 1198_IL3148]
MKTIKLLFLLLALTIVVGCSPNTESIAQGPPEKPVQNIVDLSKSFKDITGTLVVKDIQSGQLDIYNEVNAQKSFSPMSSFKIMNSLVALQSGVIHKDNSTKKWDGALHPISTWNQDHDLQSAFANSVVWYYQELAPDIGADTMKKYITENEYGNQDISKGNIDDFWLDQGSLKISALEQISFLEKLCTNSLSFDQQVQQDVKEIMVIKKIGNTEFAGKTGSSQNGFGWFVGYLKNGDQIKVFATNVEGLVNKEDPPAGFVARDITVDALKSLKYLPEEFSLK